MTATQTVFPFKAEALFFALLICIILLAASAQRVEAGNEISLISKDQILETSSNTMWRADRSKKLERVEDAESYLKKLNQGAYNDWRFPTKVELYDLFTIFDLKKNGDVKIRLEGYYWLVDDKKKKYIGGWQIGDGCGPSRSFYTGRKGYVRAIRP